MAKKAQGEQKAKAPKEKKDRKNAAKKHSRMTRWQNNIFRTLKSAHNEIGISGKAMGIVNAWILDMAERLAREAGALCKTKRQTVTAREITTACKLHLPAEFDKHARAQATRAATKYDKSFET